MSFRVRSLLVVVIGTVLGLTVSLGSSVLNMQPARRAADRDPSEEYAMLLVDVMRRIRTEYVDNVDDKKLVESAIRGMLEELDPHSRYLDPTHYEDIRISASGNYSGVGLDISLNEGRVTVVAPLDDAPAAMAGILAGDIVVSVDNVPVEAANVEDAISRMRGAPGTQVRLGVARDGAADLLEFSLTRAEISLRTVRSEYLGDGIAYIRLTGFGDQTAAELDTVAAELEQVAGSRLEAVVLDLRNNPGGVLNAAVDVADQFLAGGLIVRGRGRVHQSRFEQYAEAGDAFEDVRLAVIVNAGSASGAEIVAGAIKDHGRGRLIGERTYGKGSVQSVLPLGLGNAIKLTTARYITPSGRSINGTGIEPDQIVRNGDPSIQYRGPGSPIALEADQQLLSALEAIGYESISLSQAP
jgi:carboxyl-terminal processing protease